MGRPLALLNDPDPDFNPQTNLRRQALDLSVSRVCVLIWSWTYSDRTGGCYGGRLSLAGANDALRPAGELVVLPREHLVADVSDRLRSVTGPVKYRNLAEQVSKALGRQGDIRQHAATVNDGKC